MPLTDLLQSTSRQKTESPLLEGHPFDPDDPDDCASLSAQVSRWLPRFAEHQTFAEMFRGIGLRVISIERILTHPVWVARVHRASTNFSRNIPILVGQLRSVFRKRGFRLYRGAPSVRQSNQYLRVGWVWEIGEPGMLVWDNNDIQRSIVYEETPEELELNRRLMEEIAQCPQTDEFD